MSIVVISVRDEFIAIATDRRSTMGETIEIEEAKLEWAIYFDDERKSYCLAEPHNCFVFTAHGTERVDVGELLPEFEGSLPSHPLDIKDYAERLSDFYGKKYPTSFPKDEDPLEFHVVGFNMSNQMSAHYRFEIPSNPNVRKEPMRDSLAGPKDLDLDHTSMQVTVAFRDYLWAKLKAKKRRDGLSTAEMRIYRDIKSNRDFKPSLEKSHIFAYASQLISAIAQKQVARDERLTVGGGVMNLVITRETGVEIEKPAKSIVPRLSANAHHSVKIFCCQTYKFQLDRNKTLKPGYSFMPDDGHFACSNCELTSDLSSIVNKFEAESAKGI